MKIANAPAILATRETRNETAKSLVGGETVLVKAEDVTAPKFSPELLRTISLGGSAVSNVNLSPVVRTELNKQGISLGAGTGAVVGAGVGILLQQLKQVHPTSAVALDAACAMIGAGIGAAVGSGMFEIEPGYHEGKWSMKVRAVTPKS